MKIYDEENPNLDGEEEEEFSGYTMIEEHSIFNVAKAAREENEPGWASPIPQNEQTVILFEASVAGVKDGAPVTLSFCGNACTVTAKKKIGVFKEAFVKKLRTERGGTGVRAYFKADTPPMVRLVFGEGEVIPPAEPEEKPDSSGNS